ncbi:MAG: MerR family transcriptional regulator [Bacteroidales bacterium]|nr:MerR family transcriptional regulator [Bacteroidales bacterium]
MAQYNIKDLETLTGIKAHTIRIWEKRYGIITPARTDTNIRTYDDVDLRRILNISILNSHGIKISKLANMSDEEIRDKVLFVSQNMSDFQTQIEALIFAMFSLDEAHFHHVFNKSVMTNGFETTFEEIVMKALDRVGVLWLTGTINPAQEHFLSNLVRQKLISNIDSISVVSNPNKKRFTLFLPEGELHEMGLLYAQFLLKKRGHDVMYFGQQTPLVSVFESEKLRKSDFLLISMVAPLNEISIEDYLKEVKVAFPTGKILLFGKQSGTIVFPEASGFQHFATIKEFVAFVENIRD